MPTNVNYQGGGNLAVTITEDQIAAIQQMLGNVADAETVLKPAINEAARRIRTRLVTRIREDLNLQAGTIRDRINLSQRATANELTAIIHIDYKPVPLIDFKARFRQKSGRGVAVTTIRPQGSVVFKHMFGATMASGHTGIFERALGAKHVAQGGRYFGRVIKRGPRKGQPILRHGIKQSYGPSIVSSFENAPGLADAAIDEGAAFLMERIDSKIQAKLSGAF